MPRMAKAVDALALATLFGLALWFRITSLGGMPFSDADEAFFGLQAQRLLAGRAFEWQTPTGNLVSPTNTVPLALLLSVCRPSMALLRVPALVCGLLTVGLTYRLGARIVGRAAALIAAGIVATLP